MAAFGIFFITGVFAYLARQADSFNFLLNRARSKQSTNRNTEAPLLDTNEVSSDLEVKIPASVNISHKEDDHHLLEDIELLKSAMLSAIYMGIMDGITDEVCKWAIHDFMPSQDTDDEYKQGARMFLNDVITRIWLSFRLSSSLTSPSSKPSKTKDKASENSTFIMQSLLGIFGRKIYTSNDKLQQENSSRNSQNSVTKGALQKLVPVQPVVPLNIEPSDIVGNNKSSIHVEFLPSLDYDYNTADPEATEDSNTRTDNQDEPFERDNVDDTQVYGKILFVAVRFVVIPVIMQSLAHSVPDFSVHYLIDTLKSLNSIPDDGE